jgi:hypothetical protein
MLWHWLAGSTIGYSNWSVRSSAISLSIRDAEVVRALGVGDNLQPAARSRFLPFLLFSLFSFELYDSN